MARRPIVAGNWKMNTTRAEARQLAADLVGALGPLEDVDRVLCPPFVWLADVARAIEGSHLRLGAQNLHWEPKGAFTGEVSPAMIAELCQYVIVGHSERRQYFGETDATVGRRLAAARAHGLSTILCVGENLADYDAGASVATVANQVGAALEGHNANPSLVIAYEPVWAIGTGRAATAEHARTVIAAIRASVKGLWGADSAESLRVQYGGSVTAANAAEFFATEGIDGALVGGASLRPAEFTAIVRAASRV
ncbi:MAG: triose-phosphate isomerase [Chloroflexi bacterium]|nr:triose-phosphate isomerase [Chloroflexota bacterium]